MRTTYLWHIWPARHWPSSAQEERRFVDDLTQRATLTAGEVRPFERGDLTAVLNTLRNGMSLDELLSVAPGVHIDRLLSAYRHIDAQRQQSYDAFHALCLTLNPTSLQAHRRAAATLMPVPTHHLTVAVHGDLAAPDGPAETDDTSRADVDSYLQRVELRRVDIAAVVAAVSRDATQVEADLANRNTSTDDRIELGRLLYDPFAGGIWSSPYYLPERVGTLVPARVRDLLGEPTE